MERKTTPNETTFVTGVKMARTKSGTGVGVAFDLHLKVEVNAAGTAFIRDASGTVLSRDGKKPWSDTYETRSGMSGPERAGGLLQLLCERAQRLMQEESSSGGE